MKQKKIKVQYRNRVSGDYESAVPMIQMTGLWLEKMGFSIGDTIMLEYDDSGIHIRPLSKEEKVQEQQAALEATIRQKEKELRQLQEQKV